jgi:U2 small nuclear ribonucleoprotein B''
MSIAAEPVPMEGIAPSGAVQSTAISAAPAPPEEPASETLYIQNLNERIKIPGGIDAFLYLRECLRLNSLKVMKQTLRALFKSYGEVLDVVAHANLRMRGQAFVSFPDTEIARKAQKEVRGFPLYGKPMVRADATQNTVINVLTAKAANNVRANTVGCGGQKAGWRQF